jgi:peptidoglycan hydrolase CwlO-like protein
MIILNKESKISQFYLNFFLLTVDRKDSLIILNIWRLQVSNLDSAEKKLHETIAKLSHEIDSLSSKIKEIPILENKNNELAQKNHNLDNEIKILKSDFIELKNFAGSISDQLDESIYSIKDILDS